MTTKRNDPDMSENYSLKGAERGRHAAATPPPMRGELTSC